MALEAVLGEEGANVLGEIDRGVCLQGWRTEKPKACHEGEEKSLIHHETVIDRRKTFSFYKL
jgi:hypothetical protein